MHTENVHYSFYCPRWKVRSAAITRTQIIDLKTYHLRKDCNSTYDACMLTRESSRDPPSRFLSQRLPRARFTAAKPCVLLKSKNHRSSLRYNNEKAGVGMNGETGGPNHVASAESDSYCSTLRCRNEKAVLRREWTDHLAYSISRDTSQRPGLMARLSAATTTYYFSCQSWQRGLPWADLLTHNGGSGLLI